jgi:hypothetical protein
LIVDPALPDGGNFFGFAGVREYMEQFLDSWERVTITHLEVRTQSQPRWRK